MSNISNWRCPLTPGLPAIVVQRWTCVLWNQRVKWSRMNQSQPTKPSNQPTTTTTKITKHLIGSPTSKYINQLLKQNESTNALWINILLVGHFRIEQLIMKTITDPPRATKHSALDIRAWATVLQSSWMESDNAGVGYCRQYMRQAR